MPPPLSLADLDAAAAIVYTAMDPTPQRRWPSLDRLCGVPVWVKHENETPAGAFKIRGGLTYFDDLIRHSPHVAGVVAATRGNHGQSAAFAASRHHLPVAVVVPEGNSRMKNQAMRDLGADVIERGRDFQESLEIAAGIARERGWELMPSFDDRLIRGVASYSLELLRAAPGIRTLYVPIGLGSGICGAIAARDALNISVDIVAVVSAQAPAYAVSLATGTRVSRDAVTRIADGMACRTPVEDALARIRAGAARVIEVSDDEVEDAMRVLFEAAHSVAEGAGAASLAALRKDAHRADGEAAIVLTGANVDPGVFARVLLRA